MRGLSLISPRRKCTFGIPNDDDDVSIFYSILENTITQSNVDYFGLWTWRLSKLASIVAKMESIDGRFAGLLSQHSLISFTKKRGQSWVVIVGLKFSS